MCSQSECQLEKPDWTYFSSFIKTLSFMECLVSFWISNAHLKIDPWRKAARNEQLPIYRKEL
jgi:hypothetical protein